MVHAITLGLCLEKVNPGDTRRVRSTIKTAHDVPHGRCGLWGCCTHGNWGAHGGCRGSRKGEERCVGAVLGCQYWWRTVCAKGEISQIKSWVIRLFTLRERSNNGDLCPKWAVFHHHVLRKGLPCPPAVACITHTQHMCVHNFVTHTYNTKASLIPVPSSTSPLAAQSLGWKQC